MPPSDKNYGIIPWNPALALTEPELRLADSRVPLFDCCTEPGAPKCRYDAACHCEQGYCDCPDEWGEAETDE